MSDERELKRLKQLFQEEVRKDNEFRKADAFKKYAADEKSQHDEMFWQSEAGDIASHVGELETKIFL